MNISVTSSPQGADILCYMINENGAIPYPSTVPDSALRQIQKDLDGRFNHTIHTANPEGDPPRILLAGLGPKEKMDQDTIRHVAGTIAKKVEEMRIHRFAIQCPEGYDPQESAAQIVEGAMLALYKFDQYKAKKADKAPDMTIVSKSNITDAVRRAEATSSGVILTRDVANQPPNECPPEGMASYAEHLARHENVTCTVLSDAELVEGGFGGIIAVGKGSANTPRLIILQYNGGQGNPVALVGKAVTFDTGGISIKPGEKMDEMKFDKCGGCTVLGIIDAAARMKLPVNIVGAIPSVENMPGGESYRPGDIIKLYNGKTAEILNTDAEGRLILADALSYVERKFAPRAIIDFATLTGACIIALGCDVAGMVSNDDDLVIAIQGSSAQTAEGIWRLPLDRDYMDMVKSKVADIKNLGSGRAAGTIAAAAFLRNAIETTPWMHLDIAGTAWVQPPSKNKPYNPPGATGFGVRLILDYLCKL